MKVEIDKKFQKDALRLSKEIQKELVEVISKIEQSENLTEFDVTKMAGFTNAFRIRFGKYRLGYFLVNDVVILARVAKRDEIYKIFP